MEAVITLLISANVVAIFGLVVRYYTFKKWNKQNKNEYRKNK